MNWYKNTIKLAAAKNKIQQFKVDDPSLKLFIYKYENTIPWEQIKSSEDIQNYIKGNLIPSLQEKINPENEKSNYLKHIDLEREFQQDPDNPQVQQAYALFQRNPQEAENSILKNINADKKKSFFEWWKYTTEEADEYKDNPALIYSILKPIIDSSPATQKVGPPPLNAEVLSLIWEEINTQGSTQINILKRYKKISSKLDKKSSKVISTGSGNEWIYIPSKKASPDNYPENLKKLMRFSQGTGWCIAGNSYADRYLSQGDFWLYLEGGTAKVAIRLQGDKKVAEIRGQNNKQENLDPYWEEVTSFLQNTNFDYKNNSHYKSLEKVMLMNADLEKDPEKYQMALRSIQENPENYKTLSEKNKRKFPEFRQTAAKGYEEKMHTILNDVESVDPGKSSQYRSKFDTFQRKYNSIPEEIKSLMSEGVEGRILTVHRNVFQKDPLAFDDFPPEIQASIPDEERVSAWRNYIQDDPYRYNNPNLPDDVKKRIPVESVTQAWKELVTFNSKHIDNMNSDILNLINSDPKDPNFIKNIVLSDFQKNPISRAYVRGQGRVYEKLERIKKMRLMSEQEISQVYAQFANRNPNLAKFIPNEYKSQATQNMATDKLDIIIEQSKPLIQADSQYFNRLNKDVQVRFVEKYPNFVASSFERTKQRYGPNLRGFWNSIPDVVKPIMPMTTKQEMGQYYFNFISRKYPEPQRFPAIMTEVPPDLQPFVLSKFSSKRNWYIKLS